MSGEQQRFELSVPQIAGGALAAVTAAVAASYLGVAGTFVGAAVASIASTVGGAVYTHYLTRANDQIKQHTVVAWRDNAEPPVHVEGEGELATAVHATVREERDSSPTLVMAPVAPVEPRRRLPWPKLLAAAALVFAISAGVILAYQAFAHETVHETVTGKTGAVERDKGEPRRQQEENAPVAPPVSDEPGSRGPTPTPTSTPTPTPTPTPTATPSTTPTPTPATPTPTDSASAEPTPSEAQSDRGTDADQSPPAEDRLEQVPDQP